MVNNVVTAAYTETYDLNTAVGELSLLGLHTPQAPALQKMFRGFFEQYKKFKIVGCDLRMVCASQQTLTPDLVGLEAGQVDPRDVLNPILFKACTGENLNLLLDQIYGGTGDVTTDPFDGASVNQKNITNSTQLALYYQLLSDETFRKSHPQAGLTVTGLVPMVHKIVSTRPFRWAGAPGQMGPETDSGNAGTPVNLNGIQFDSGNPMSSQALASLMDGPNQFVTNGVTNMPWLDTTVVYTESNANPGIPSVKLISMVPRVYLGCIVLPPAILQRLFFRMQIRWIIQFKDFRPAQEVGKLAYASSLDEKQGMVANGAYTTYWNLYHNATPTKGLLKEESSFTTTDTTEVDKVMEKVQ